MEDQEKQFAKAKIDENIREGRGRPSFRKFSEPVQEWAKQLWKEKTSNIQDMQSSQSSASTMSEQPLPQTHTETNQQSLFKKRKLWEAFQTQQQRPLKKRKIDIDIDIEQQTTNSEFTIPEPSQPPLQKLKIYKEIQGGKSMFFSRFVTLDESSPQTPSSGPSAST
ncbi:hypothetical protein [Piscirickettsia salmonis]|uniref:hypothetical protein n=1 Tax=Piscirickettsia salmonis TaxID=1238 RepID=UPI0007C91A35|nr:hypothetical protein A0O36_02297 [Piscirickettsiaceae bacterium NZ-RLO1]